MAPTLKVNTLKRANEWASRSNWGLHVRTDQSWELADGSAVVGRVTSGGYGYSVGRSIAYAYLPPEHASAGTEVAVEIFGRWVEGEVAEEPLFDPSGERLRK